MIFTRRGYHTIKRKSDEKRQTNYRSVCRYCLLRRCFMQLFVTYASHEPAFRVIAAAVECLACVRAPCCGSHYESAAAARADRLRAGVRVAALNLFAALCLYLIVRTIAVCRVLQILLRTEFFDLCGSMFMYLFAVSCFMCGLPMLYAVYVLFFDLAACVHVFRQLFVQVCNFAFAERTAF